MRCIDSHVHIGDYRIVEEALKSSPYKGYYRLYDDLTSESVKFQDSFISKNELVFGIPIVLAEISIRDSNRFLSNYSANAKNVFPIYLIGDDIEFYKTESSYFLKEHFIVHDFNDRKNRSPYYDYLNMHNGFLLIHSLSSIRIDYIKYLRKNFQKMRIIIAHMGRDGKNTFEFMNSILTEFKNDSDIFFDTSTINIPEYLKYGIKTIGASRILYGSDFPYSCSGMEEPKDFYSALFKIGLTSYELEQICYKNSNEILHLCSR